MRLVIYIRATKEAAVSVALAHSSTARHVGVVQRQSARSLQATSQYGWALPLGTRIAVAREAA